MDKGGYVAMEGIDDVYLYTRRIYLKSLTGLNYVST